MLLRLWSSAHLPRDRGNRREASHGLTQTTSGTPSLAPCNKKYEKQMLILLNLMRQNLLHNTRTLLEQYQNFLRKFWIRFLLIVRTWPLEKGQKTFPAYLHNNYIRGITKIVSLASSCPVLGLFSPSVFLYTLHSFHNNYLNLALSSSSAPGFRQLVWIA